MKDRHPFLVSLSEWKKRENEWKQNKNKKKRRRRYEKWSRVKNERKKPEKLQFKIHMPNKFYVKLYCGRICSCGEWKTHFVFFSRKKWKKKKIYAIFKILFIFKCASNVAHFFHFDFYRYGRRFSFSSFSLTFNKWKRWTENILKRFGLYVSDVSKAHKKTQNFSKTKVEAEKFLWTKFSILLKIEHQKVNKWFLCFSEFSVESSMGKLLQTLWEHKLLRHLRSFFVKR